MDTRDAAILKATLVGVDLPASPSDLSRYAVAQGAQALAVARLGALEEDGYSSLDDVVEELLRVQPPRLDPDAREPHEESGAPPGGDAYTA